MIIVINLYDLSLPFSWIFIKVVISFNNDKILVQIAEEEVQLSKEEKKLLGTKIRKLGQKYMRGIINIVKDEHQQKDNKVEFDINKLSARTNRRLMAYVDQCISEANGDPKQ